MLKPDLWTLNALRLAIRTRPRSARRITRPPRLRDPLECEKASRSRSGGKGALRRFRRATRREARWHSREVTELRF